jgi:hypothetical protein
MLTHTLADGESVNVNIDPILNRAVDTSKAVLTMCELENEVGLHDCLS